MRSSDMLVTASTSEQGKKNFSSRLKNDSEKHQCQCVWILISRINFVESKVIGILTNLCNCMGSKLFTPQIVWNCMIISIKRFYLQLQLTTWSQSGSNAHSPNQHICNSNLWWTVHKTPTLWTKCLDTPCKLHLS